MQSLLVQFSLMTFSGVFLDVLLLLTCLIVTTTYHTKYGIFRHWYFTQFLHLRLVHLWNCLPLRTTNHGDWLCDKFGMQVGLSLRIERLLVLRV